MINKFTGKYSFLSNFYTSPMNVHGIGYPTVEHAFQAAKTNDEYLKVKIAEAPTPSKAKWLGRRVPLRPDWEEVKIEVMKDLIRLKFNQFPYLAAKLLETGDKELVENNYWGDTFWGICNSKGKNNLGKILMDIRQELVEGKVD